MASRLPVADSGVGVACPVLAVAAATAAAAADAVVVVVVVVLTSDGTAGGGLNAEQSQSELQHEPNRHPLAWRRCPLTSLGTMPTDRCSSCSSAAAAAADAGAGVAAALSDGTGASSGVAGMGASAVAVAALRRDCCGPTTAATAVVTSSCSSTSAAIFGGAGGCGGEHLGPCEAPKRGTGALEASGGAPRRGGELVGAVGVGRLAVGACL